MKQVDRLRKIETDLYKYKKQVKREQKNCKHYNVKHDYTSSFLTINYCPDCEKEWKEL